MRLWWVPLACLVALVGYFAPWANHPTAGLVVTGLDLGEYVKFLPPVRGGEIWLWRPGFYAPLVAVSAGCILAAYRPDQGYAPWQRTGLLLVALVSALNLLPPAWTPTRLFEVEFRWQAGALVALLAGIGLSPFLALLPRRGSAILVTLLAAAALVFPAQGFFAVLPTMGKLMARPVFPSWGFWLMPAGLLALIAAWWLPIAQPVDASAGTSHANK